ncbi:MAG: Peptidyl-prolyl cis-trans isomerase fkbp12, partial [Cercozoa sp. M6MM]
MSDFGEELVAGQLWKKVLQPGEGGRPCKGTEAVVHYTGTLLDGTQFDSSRDRNEHFRFPVGQGRVIRGWDVGVASMQKGERAMLTCAPEYAYGAAGAPPAIPPNSTLQFDVELFDFTVDKAAVSVCKSMLRQIKTLLSKEGSKV